VTATQSALEAAREVAAAGHRVVAIVGWRVPREPLLAAGLHYVQVTPAIGPPTPVADELLSSDSSPDTRSLFQLIVGGALDFASLVVLAPPFAGLSASIEDMRRAGVLREQVPPTYYFEVLTWREPASRAFMIGRVRDFVVRIATLGQSVGDLELRGAIRRCNMVRREVAALLSARSRLHGSHVLRVIAAGSSLGPEEHIAMLQGNHPMLPGQLPGVLIASSSVLYDDRVHRIVEDCGAHVLGEDDINGSCHAFGEVTEDGDPVASLGAFYHENQPAQNTAPAEMRLRWLLERAMAQDIQGVIFYAEDPSWGWDLPAVCGTIEAAGKRTLLLPRDVRTGDGAAAAARQVREFVMACQQQAVS